MATLPWSIPVGKAITGSTYIKDTDNNLSDTIDDLVAWTNNTGVHAGTGLSADFLDKASAQTATGVKTFSGGIVANVTGNVTGDVTGNADTSTAFSAGTAKTKFDGIATGAEVNTIDSDPSGVTGADQVINVMSLTQSEYDAIGTPNAATLYVIVG